MMNFDSTYHGLFSDAGMVAALLRGFVPEPLFNDFRLDAITRESAKFHADSGKRCRDRLAYPQGAAVARPVF